MAYEHISAREAKERMESGTNPLILDVRTKEEFALERIAGAVCIPVDELERRATLIPNKAREILIYCRSGVRSVQAAEILSDMGFSAVKEFGGITAWPYGTETGPQQA